MSKKLESFSSKNPVLKKIIFILFFTILPFAFYYNLRDGFKNSFFLLVILFFIIIYLILEIPSIIKKYNLRKKIQIWAKQNSYQYVDIKQKEVFYKFIIERLHSNPQKDFLSGKHYMQMRPFVNNIAKPYYIHGKYKDLEFFIYPFKTIWHTKFDDNIFSGQCIELQTVNVPVHMLITRKYALDKDTMNTESQGFEKIYNISSSKGADKLMILEPNMIDLLTHTDIMGIEFGGKSICMFSYSNNFKVEDIIARLYWGSKIAEQLKINFSKSK